MIWKKYKIIAILTEAYGLHITLFNSSQTDQRLELIEQILDELIIDVNVFFIAIFPFPKFKRILKTEYFIVITPELSPYNSYM